jgi:ABC-type uncharacterized transport system involved in gliding motility auxiliary subunit
MKNIYSASALVFLAVLFLALTILSGAAIKGARLDLTEQKLYTLSQGTINLLQAIEEPVTLEFYFSEETSADLPLVRNFARRVQELLDEMAARSGGQLRVRRVDPRPFSEQEDQADSYGLEGVPVGAAGENLYLGLVGTNMVDGLEVVPFISPAREAFLEYELARMIYILSQPERPRVGLLSGLPMDRRLDMHTGQQLEAWAIREQVGELFEVESIKAVDDHLPAGIDVLVLVHPVDLSDAMLRDIDRFVVEGGRLLLFVDPYSESDPGPDPAAAMTMDRTSSLDPLFGAWGVEFATDTFVADLGQALQVAFQAGQRPVRHPAIIGVTTENMNRDDVVTGELSAINLASPGHLALSKDSPLELEPLLMSSANAGLVDAERLRFLEDPGELMAEVAVTGERYVLAARLSGEVTSAFEPDNGHSPASGLLNAIVVADTDLLADRYWVQRQRFFGTSILDPFAGNGDFVINAIDNLLGNADLISVRSRATGNRPFTLVESLRREAERNLLATEQRLEAELAETERRLTELQQARGDTDLSVLTPEQEAELDRFMEQRIEIRRQLRQVRRDLDRDIQALGTRVKAVNIALMPALVTVLALFMAWRRRRSAKASAEGNA